MQSPLHNSNRTTQGWFLQQTRGWPWSSWTNKTTTTKHKPFYKTPTPTKSSTKTPTPQLKNKLINLLKGIKQSGGLSIQKYKQLYPTSAVSPKFYGLPKIHKTGTPLRPIVSSRGSITYGVAKELSHIIKPLVLANHHTILKTPNTSYNNFKAKKLQTGEIITSYDVKALFTSVPVQPSIQIVKHRLQQDTTLPQKDLYVHFPNHLPAGVLPHPHLLPLPG